MSNTLENWAYTNNKIQLFYCFDYFKPSLILCPTESVSLSRIEKIRRDLANQLNQEAASQFHQSPLRRPSRKTQSLNRSNSDCAERKRNPGVGVIVSSRQTLCRDGSADSSRSGRSLSSSSSSYSCGGPVSTQTRTARPDRSSLNRRQSVWWSHHDLSSSENNRISLFISQWSKKYQITKS